MVNISDYARSVSILVEIAGNPEAKLDAINKKIDGMTSKKVEVSGGSQTSSQMDNLANSTNKASNSITSFVSNLGGKVSSALGNVKTALSDVQNSMQNMASALAGMTVGGAVSGLAWKQSAESKLYNEQVKEAITNNKKLKISYEELDAFVTKQAEAGEGTKQDTVKEMYSVLTAGTKFIKGKTSEEKLSQADAITDFYFKHQEMMQEQGIGSAEQMVQRAIMTEGKMSGRFGTKFATAMGVSPDDASMKSAKARMKYFMEQGAVVNMKTEMDKRPWEQLEVNISKLKNTIADSIAGPMAAITGIVAKFVEMLVKIPGIPALIGLLGATLALTSALSLMISVLTPLWNLMKALNIISGIQTVLHISNASATVADVSAQAMLTGAMEGEFIATELNTGAQNLSLATRLRLIAVKAWDTAATWASTAANYLGITSLLGLTAASGAATSGFTLLGIATNFAASPLWLIIGAGLVLVGVLALIANKAGILQPLLKGISNIDFGKVFGKVFSLDFKGAWGDIKKGFADIKFPSMQEAFANLFGGTSIAVVLNKIFGIPMNSMVQWLDKIHSALKIVINFFTELWNLINRGLNWIRDGLGITRSQAKTKMETQAKEEGLVWQEAFGKNPAQWYKNGMAMGVNAGSPELQSLKEKYDKAPKGFFEGIPGINDLKDAIYNLIEALKLWKPEENAPPAEAPKGTPDIMAPIMGQDIANVNRDIAEGKPVSSLSTYSGNPIQFPMMVYNWWTGAGEKIEDMPVKGAASGGFVTKEGLLQVHKNEPIIPAEIASSSRLQEVLGSIAKGSTQSNTTPNIQVSMSYSAPSNANGIYLDKMSFERAVKEIIGKALRHYGSY